jgi:hypothetical protein
VFLGENLLPAYIVSYRQGFNFQPADERLAFRLSDLSGIPLLVNKNLFLLLKVNLSITVFTLLTILDRVTISI